MDKILAYNIQCLLDDFKHGTDIDITIERIIGTVCNNEGCKYILYCRCERCGKTKEELFNEIMSARDPDDNSC